MPMEMKIKALSANQTFRRTFGNSNFFETHVHLGTLTFQKNLNHQNFLENFDLRSAPLKLWTVYSLFKF
jgi:hypothetical protein